MLRVGRESGGVGRGGVDVAGRVVGTGDEARSRLLLDGDVVGRGLTQEDGVQRLDAVGLLVALGQLVAPVADEPLQLLDPQVVDVGDVLTEDVDGEGLGSAEPTPAQVLPALLEGLDRRALGSGLDLGVVHAEAHGVLLRSGWRRR